jgi:hypothetical protein
MEWISVTKRLPDEFDLGCSKDVLVVVRNKYITISAYWILEKWWFNLPKRDRDKVTHWMYLPELPK